MPKAKLQVTKYAGASAAIARCTACGLQFKTPLTRLEKVADAIASLQEQFERHICSLGNPNRSRGSMSALGGCSMAETKRCAMSRTLIWIEGPRFRGWGCSECGWIFNPSGPPSGEDFNAMKQDFESQRDKEFAAHLCVEHPRQSKPTRATPPKVQRQGFQK